MKNAPLLYLILLLCQAWCNGQVCDTPEAPTDIASFCSLPPDGQPTRLELPEGYRFQLLFKEGMVYTEDNGVVPGRNDFAGYVPNDGSSVAGYLSINHELTVGAVSILAISYDETDRLWGSTKAGR